MDFKIKVLKKNNMYIATCPELDANCYANNRDDVLRRIKEVIKFYVASAQEMGFDVNTGESLKIAGENISIKSLNDSFIKNLPQNIN